MADFDKYVPLLSKLEGYGVYTNRPKDKGGPTMSGVTLKTFRKFYGEHNTIEDLKKMTYEQWHYIMKSGYWDKVGGDRIINQSVANIFADFAINCGYITAIKKVQSLVGEDTDGVVGTLTLGAINRAPQVLVFNGLKSTREAYYYYLALKDEEQFDNLKGWLNRLKQFSFNE